MKEKQSAFDLARILAVLGGLVTVVAGAQDILSLIGLIGRRNIPSIEAVTTSVIYAVIVIVLGLVGVMGARQVRSLVWDIILIVVGLLAYRFDGGFPWFFGPILVVLAGIVGIVAKLA